MLILADRERRTERLARAAGALRAARAIGMDVAAILAADAAAELPTELTPAGRLVIPEAPALPSPIASLLGTATPLQLLTERLARARGVDPDAIHRDVDRYRARRRRRRRADLMRRVHRAAAIAGSARPARPNDLTP